MSRLTRSINIYNVIFKSDWTNHYYEEVRMRFKQKLKNE